MRDQRFENWLTREGVDYRFRAAVPLAEIDIPVSARNLARLAEPIKKSVVEEYALAMMEDKSTESFPALIAYRAPSGKLVLIDGNHRLQAALEAEIGEFDCYIVQTGDRALIDRLTREANTIEGRRHDRETSIEHAKHAYRQGGITLQEAARRFHLSMSALQTALRADDTRERIRRVGLIPGPSAQTFYQDLGRIPSDKALKEAYPIAVKAGLSGVELDQLTAATRKAAYSEEAQLKVVRDFAASPVIRDRLVMAGKNGSGYTVKRQSSPRTRLFALVRDLRATLEKHQTTEALHMSAPADITSFMEAFSGCSRAVQSIFGDEYRRVKAQPSGTNGLSRTGDPRFSASVPE